MQVKTPTASALSVFSTKIPRDTATGILPYRVSKLSHLCRTSQKTEQLEDTKKSKNNILKDKYHTSGFIDYKCWLKQNIDPSTTNKKENSNKEPKKRCAHWRNHRNHTRDRYWFNNNNYAEYYDQYLKNLEKERRAEKVEVEYDVYTHSPMDCDLTYDLKYQKRPGIGHFDRWTTAGKRK